MNGPLGIALMAVGVVGTIGLTVAWPRIERRVSLVAMAVTGAAIGTGALLVQDQIEPAEWIVTLVVFVVLAPVQAHLVLSRRRP
jgi:hypothetical protein